MAPVPVAIPQNSRPATRSASQFRRNSTSRGNPIDVVTAREGSSARPSARLALDGEDLRSLPLSIRKSDLARLLAQGPDGIFIAPFETGEIGPDLFRAACNMGLEGMVSKRSERPYRAGRSKDWIKVKNRKHPALSRVMDSFS